MAADDRTDAPQEQPMPWQQAVLDDIFLLVVFGLAIPFLVYIVWGLIELGNVPIFQP